MRVVMFYHSLISDWNHGNAHFLRGVVSELLSRGHEVTVFEPSDAWSTMNLRNEYGIAPFKDFYTHFPELNSTQYDLATLDLDEALEGADLVIVHEWNEAELVKRVGDHRARGNRYKLLFHDTHHRMVTAPHEMARFDLSDYDGVLAFGRVIADLYYERGIAQRAWVWHEAADTRVFKPHSAEKKSGDLVWIGNWGDEERAEELAEYLFEPVKSLRLSAKIHGVRYPEHALEKLRGAGIKYGGWVANFRVPELYSVFKFTVHIPRGPYSTKIPGVPTIRVFEALACGIPLISSPWNDTEGLFNPGKDFLVAKNGAEMRKLMRELTHNAALRTELAESGLRAVLSRHTCRHRVDELLAAYQSTTLPVHREAGRETVWQGV